MKWLGAVLVSLCMIAGTANAGTYRCVVHDFNGFDRDDKLFIERNRQKTFELTIGPQTVVLSMFSDHFQNYTRTYGGFDVGFSSIVAKDPDGTGLDTIIVPKNPGVRLARSGYFDAMIINAGTFYSNNWHLHCQE